MPDVKRVWRGAPFVLVVLCDCCGCGQACLNEERALQLARDLVSAVADGTKDAPRWGHSQARQNTAEAMLRHAWRDVERYARELAAIRLARRD